MTEQHSLAFGTLLSRFRIAAGLTQEELAARAALSVRGISDLERGVKTRPRAHTVRHLADALQLAPYDRAEFERSARDAAKTIQKGLSNEQALPIEGGGQPAPSSDLALGLVPRTVRYGERPMIRILGGAVVVFVIVGALVLTLRPGSTYEARPFARLVATWTLAAPFPSTLVAPAAMAFSDAGIVYVADSGADRIDAFSTHGRLLFSWGMPGRGPGQLQDPRGVAYDGVGHVYVADTGNDRIDKFSSHGQFLGSFGTRGTRSGQFRLPEGVTAGGPSGWIYVADTGNGRVQAFTPAGVPIRDWDSRKSQSSKLLRPTSLVVTGFGRVLVADGRAGQVQVLENDGSFLWHGASIPPPEFVVPSAIAQDPGGFQYILDVGLNNVRKIDDYGHVLATWHGQFRFASGLAVDAQGNVYVADTGNQRILKFAPGGSLSASWNGASKKGPPAASPRALAQDAGGNLYVADSRGNQIVVFSPSGRVIKRFGGGGSTGRLQQPSGVAVDSRGLVYVSDTGHNRIVKFSRSGKVEATWLQPGLYPGPFSGPHGLRMDTYGHVYLADTGNGRVEELTAAGAYRQVWYVEVTPPKRGLQNFPPLFCSQAYQCGQWYGMAIDARGFIYVTDTLHNLVFKLSPYGETLARWGGTGSQLGQFRTPEGVAVSGSGTMYVADTGNHRVVVLASDGKLIGIIRGGLDKPADLLLDETSSSAGTLFVADSGSGLVKKFSIPR